MLLIKPFKLQYIMSQPGKRGGRGGAGGGIGRRTPSNVAGAVGGNTPEESTTASERATPASKADSDQKDDSSSNGDKKEAEGFPTPKPPSAGASIRDTSNKILALAMKGEWTPIEQELKKLEKYVANAGEDGNHIPLAGIHDPVSLSTHISFPWTQYDDEVNRIATATVILPLLSAVFPLITTH